MSFRRRGSFRGIGNFRRTGMRPVINSIKNEINSVQGVVAATNLVLEIAKAVDNRVTANATEVNNGSVIKAIWVEFWYYGLSASNTNDIFDAYIIKNPGNNLTNPNPGTVGTSNEKKFVIKEWKGLTGNKSLGGSPYWFRGWVKLPRRYWRMGTDDIWFLVVRSPTTGNFCSKFIYKWFS